MKGDAGEHWGGKAIATLCQHKPVPSGTARILLAPWQTRAGLEPGRGSGSHGRDNILEPGCVYGDRGAFNCSTAGEKGIFCRHVCSPYWQPSSWEFIK